MIGATLKPWHFYVMHVVFEGLGDGIYVCNHIILLDAVWSYNRGISHIIFPFPIAIRQSSIKPIRYPVVREGLRFLLHPWAAKTMDW